MQPILITFSLFLNFSKIHFPMEQPRIKNLLYFRWKKKFSSRKLQHLTIFETDAPGSWKQPCLNTEFQGIPVKFRRFLNFLKLKHRILEPIFYKNIQLTKYAKAVCDWAILPNLMQSKQDFTEIIFRSVSNNNLHT